LLAASPLSAVPGYGQASDEIVTVQPSIMVLPFVKQGEDIRTILEDDPNLGIAVTTIQKAFDQRGFTTIDFRGALKAATTRGGMTLGNQESLKQAIIENAGSDIYVEARITVDGGASGASGTVQLNGVDSYTGGALSNEVCRSRRFRTDDVGRLAEQALEGCLDNFLNTMNEKFGQIVDDGRSIVLDIKFAPDSDLDMYAEVGSYGDVIADALEDWMDEHAYKNNYRIKGSGDVNMLVDDFRIPLREPGTERNYRPRKLGRELRRYVTRELGIDAQMDVLGSTVYLTLGNRR
jgi:hypothetical protein